ncbi:phage minor tail protein G [Pseudocitrobacter sp. 2023EL-00150]|uniref:phage tail assembly chaperone G n=1 Tax=Pseudocitrobacter sp. 2023EL-00150 TaxID=3032322 RepID=UPI0023E36A4D|nr:phage minor tail protein G [Pseudocitrobacter sp. 2023EL-00150]MDF3830234.1 phage minor tail protein G [Pseudocitrobacter sp. 2023EL-00150]
MFLKTEQFEWNGTSITLHELSALQRIEYLEYLKKIEAIEDGDIQTAMGVTIQTAAFVVAMSVWHEHKLKGTMPGNVSGEVAAIQEEVVASWPLDAISTADYKVKLLSGMITPLASPSDESRAEDREPVTAEKSSPVS